jgi:hypothetical protein
MSEQPRPDASTDEQASFFPSRRLPIATQQPATRERSGQSKSTAGRALNERTSRLTPELSEATEFKFTETSQARTNRPLDRRHDKKVDKLEKHGKFARYAFRGTSTITY